jgi:hypothetical protein
VTDSPAAELRAAAQRLTLTGARILVAPRLVQPLADWLTGIEISEHAPMDDEIRHALTVARAILDNAPPEGPTPPQEPRSASDASSDEQTAPRPSDGHRSDPAEETPAYTWAQVIDTIDRGRTIRIPGIHYRNGGEEERAVIVSREDLPVLRAMLNDADDTAPAAELRGPCPGFPDTCPNLVPVAPTPYHGSGIRCGCDEAPLRKRYAAAIRDAACTGTCGLTEAECSQHRIQPVVWHHGTMAEVSGTPEMLADAVLTVRDRTMQLLRSDLKWSQNNLAEADAAALDATTPAERPGRPDPVECEHEAALERTPTAAAIADVRALHYPIAGPGPRSWCVTCGGGYPCPTREALDQPADTTTEDQ